MTAERDMEPEPLRPYRLFRGFTFTPGEVGAMAVSGAQRGISDLGCGSVCGCSGAWCPMAGNQEMQKCSEAGGSDPGGSSGDSELLDES